jgi:allophanate hydrolase subunit 2
MFGKLLSGSRAYMSYSLSSNLPKVLGSFSTHLTANFGGFFGRQFKAGDKLFLHTGENKNAAYRTISEQYQINYSRSYLLRCVSSVESELFSDVQKTSFLNKKYTVSKNSNRMGIRLSDIAMKFISPINIVSSGLTQGSIQITPSGHAIISSVDGQTIGGYPRIANVISADLPILGQLKAKDKINFLFVSHQKAQQIFIEQNKILNTLFEEPEFQIS